MASQLLGIKTRFTNDLGSPLVGGQVYTYFAGTSTNQDSYSDAALTVPNTNPVILDDTGSADIFLKGAYRIRVFDKSGRFIEEQDNVTQAAKESDVSGLLAIVNTNEETRALGLNGFDLINSFELGATITQRNQALRHTATGKLYRWAGDLPKTVPASSTPTSSGGIGANAWLEVSDVALRQDLANPDKGGDLVHVTTSTGTQTVSEALDSRLFALEEEKTLLVPSDYPTLQQAVDYASKFYATTNTSINILIESGYTLNNQLTLKNRDLRNVTIRSEDATVPVDTSGFKPNVFSLASATALISAENSRLPNIDTLFVKSSGSAGVWGISLTAGSELQMFPNSGAQGFYNGLSLEMKSSAWVSFPDALGLFEPSNELFSCSFSNSEEFGVRAYYGSSLDAPMMVTENSGSIANNTF